MAFSGKLVESQFVSDIQCAFHLQQTRNLPSVVHMDMENRSPLCKLCQGTCGVFKNFYLVFFKYKITRNLPYMTA